MENKKFNLRKSKRAAIYDTDDEIEAPGPKRQRPIEETSEFPRAGKIERIQLINFMCHSNLLIELGSRINFLVGCNGSGKSAVLAALVVGLGARAKITSRSSSMQQFIKLGESTARVEITLCNVGVGAYEPAVYGKSITVVRTITQHSAVILLKNEHGKVISKKMDVLNRILLFLNVQVDNPAFLMNQDGSREFLKDLEPSKNYKLFLKATQIDLVMEILNDTQKSSNEHLIEIKLLKEKIKKNMEDVAKLRAKEKELKWIESAKEFLDIKQRELHWLLVKTIEDDIKSQESEIEALGRKCALYVSEIKGKNDLETKLKDDVIQLEAEIAEKHKLFNKEQSLFERLKSDIRNINGRIEKTLSDISGFKERIDYFTKQYNDLQKSFDEASQRGVNDIAETRTKNEDALKQLRVCLADNEAIGENAKRDLKVFKESKIEIEENKRNLNNELQEHKARLRQVEIQIKNTIASAKDKHSIYGIQMPQLIKEIIKLHQAGKFSELPRGPIGSYIEVPNEKYRDVVELQLRSIVEAFIVSTTSDRETLKGLLTKKFPSIKPIIITSRFQKQVYDVRQGRVTPPRGTVVLMDQIQCSDPVIMNCLIDRLRIETTLLTQNHKTAEEYTKNRENVPQNMSKIIVPGLNVEYFPTPNYRMYSLHINPARYIQVNVKQRLTEMKLEEQNIKKKVESISADINMCSTKIQEAEIIKKNGIIAQYEQKKFDLLEKIKEVDNYDYPDINVCEVMKTELLNHANKISDSKKKMQDATTNLNNLQKEKERIECEFQTQKRTLEQSLQNCNAPKESLEKTKFEVRSLELNFQKNKAKLAATIEVQQDLLKTKLATEKRLEKAAYEAHKKGKRVETESTVDELKLEISKLKEKVKQRDNITQTEEEIKYLIIDKVNEFEVHQKTYEAVKRTYNKCKGTVSQRYNKLASLQSHMKLMFNYSFTTVLQYRNFGGDAKFENDTLTITVQPRKGTNGNTKSDTRSLSGGERSFATIAFLISLWSCVDHPFYFLDEYDVFTDEINRDIMTKLLVSEGSRRANKQFTLLTPLDMSIKATPTVKLHRLDAPIRR